MIVVHGVRNLPKPFSSSVLTIGNFDGVHLGHRALIERVVKQAREASSTGSQSGLVPSVVMTFEPHPVKVLYPDRKLNRIFEFDDQKEQLQALGVDALVVEPFSREFSQLTPDRYLQEWVYRPFSPLTLVVGYDFNFGVGRQGSIELLRDRARDMGFQVEVVSPFRIHWPPGAESSTANTNEVLVSSTRIRQALEEGEVALARALLGRPFYVRGIVEKGAGRGRTIGIPTANLRTRSECVPARGVYCAWAHARGSRWKSVVNIGMNPTFNASETADGSHPLSVEAHLLDFTRSTDPTDSASNIYGENIQLDFVERLRDEQKFAGVDALVAQIRRDIVRGAEILNAE